MKRLTEWSETGTPFYPKCFEEPCLGMGECLDDKCKLRDEQCIRLAAYEDIGPDPKNIIERIEFEKMQCTGLLKKMGSFTLCDECTYCEAEDNPYGKVRWCRLTQGLDGDLEPRAGCSRGKAKEIDD